MPKFKKVSVDELRFNNINFLKKMGSTAEMLITYSEKTEHHKKIKELVDDILYLLPIEKDSINEIDKRINNILGDLKILLYTNRDPYRIESKINDLQKLLEERNTKI